MKRENEHVIALLGQPNSGKTTLFNTLTGKHARVGNWPGKTVDIARGSFEYGGEHFCCVDLPGTYSLSAASEEERVTRDFIASGEAELVVIVADASQPERSLYMLADFAGICVPVLLVFNMIDVAAALGIRIEPRALERAVGVACVAMSASDAGGYGGFCEALVRALGERRFVRFAALMKLYSRGEGTADAFRRASALVPEAGEGAFSGEWLAVKLAESEPGRASAFATCRFKWIDMLVVRAVKSQRQNPAKLDAFTRAATGRVGGVILALMLALVGLIASFAISYPFELLSGLIRTEASPTLFRHSACGEPTGSWLRSFATHCAAQRRQLFRSRVLFSGSTAFSELRGRAGISLGRHLYLNAP